ncbi:MAG: PAS domain-containing protein [Bacteroidota bacterium]|nr:PAS domain-containing protein [Bacteroidota bacterium]
MQDEKKNTTSNVSDNDFRNLTEVSPAATCVISNVRIIYMNNSCLRLFGLETAGDMIGKNYLELFHPDNRDNIKSRLNFSNGNLLEFSSEERLNRFDGQTILAHISTKTIIFQGKPSVLIVFYDITATKRAEDELRITQEHYRSLLSKLPDYVFIQAESKILYVNESMLKVSGYEIKEVLNKSAFDFIDTKDHRRMVESINRRLSSPDKTYTEVGLILKSGKRKLVNMKGELIRYENKNALLLVFSDIDSPKKKSLP